MSTAVADARPAAATDEPARRTPDWWRVAAAPAVAALIAGAILPSGRKLWTDEYVTAYAAQLSWTELFRLLRNIDLVHALYYFVMHLWVDVFGVSEIALRAPSVIAMAVAAGTLAVLGRRLAGTPTGVLAGVLFAVVPAVSRYAQEARSYAWVSALVLLSTLGLTSAVRDPRRRRWVLYGAGLVALTYLHFVALLVVPAHAVLVWYRRRSTGRAFLVTVGIAAVLAAPMAWFAKGQDDQVSWIGRDEAKVAGYPTELFGSHAVAWAVMIAGAYGAVALWQNRSRIVPFLLVWALLPPLVSYAVYPAMHIFLAKYALYTLPAWVLLAAAAIVVPLDRPGPRLLRYRRFALPAAVLVVLALGWPAQVQYRDGDTLGEPDYHAAAAYVRTQLRAGDAIAYSAPAGRANGRLPFAYELRTAGSHPHEVFQKTSGAAVGSYGGIACTDPAKCVGSTERMWVVAVDAPADDPLHDFPEAQRTYLTGEFSVAGTQRFRRLQVALLLRHPEVEG
ncbi:glycosyltransferase family 39 protein [Dactylosporangium vinaceum]|uniref:Glycosyltransferase family 39 protein n=1 Tax=Dactylosporangium vinaceum TaxID=53362 RepID=A0ABV5MN71_9ACTN|nr:glycosyltransferase family 39 protein [Dactylosporangium vinaceum]UAB97709.1 glycosyltransferase family 39 protein [Dactylosporangium vinaceum]